MDILITLRFLLLGLTAQYIGGFTPRFLLILVVIYFCSHSYNYKLFFSSSSFNLWTCADGVVISMIRITRTVEHSAAAQNYINLYPAFISLVDQHLPAGYKNVFARPFLASDGAIEWYSEINGQPVSLTSLPPAEKENARTLLQQKLVVIEQLYQKLSINNAVPDEVMQLLSLASRQPDERGVWVVDGQPVITAWSESPAMPTLPVASKGRRWLWLLLVLLVLLAFLLLRGCISTAKLPVQGAPAPAPQPVKQICPAKRTKQQAPEMVLIFDASGSMSISMDITPDELRRLMQDQPVKNFDREPRRISLAHRSAKQVIDEVPKDMDISLVSAATCQQVYVTPAFSFAQRDELKQAIDKIQPVGKTALAEALEKAGKLVDGVDRDAIIVLITDGEETCGGDPCTVAQQLKQKKPRLQVNVVDIMNTGAGNCIASQTGGAVYAVNNTHEFNEMMNQAIKEYIPEGCE
ncbi:VWA domain-containing protein [Leclercia adecarboxylata]|uniref:VWA domain-containing protein n=1 Tax=Leclercia adecarboxylata TaxID=83655 RepID=UPI0021F2243D|nr:VWA domain-containing protein [Leclercia adecarboxylata]UYM58269.1 VWA domain-containing protein [Leclercia adecarboxylata]